MPLSPSHFKQGQSGNPNGRPVGSPNKRSAALAERLRERGDIVPADFCSLIVSNQTESTELRLQASNYLLPYLYNKRGTVAALRYIEEPVDLPRATTLEQVNSNIALISEMKALGRIDLDFADSLISDNRTIANNLIAEEELKLKMIAAGETTGEQRIVISGGMPPLPGCEIIMPELNGDPVMLGPARGPKQDGLTNGHAPVIDHADTPAIDSPAQAPEPEPQSVIDGPVWGGSHDH
jgi:hypothetical protein